MCFGTGQYHACLFMWHVSRMKRHADPFEVPRKMAESGSSLCTVTLFRESVVPSLHLFSRCRAAKGALSSKTSTTRRPASYTMHTLSLRTVKKITKDVNMLDHEKCAREDGVPKSSVPCRMSRTT